MKSSLIVNDETREFFCSFRKVLIWFLISVCIATIGWITGMKTIIPGPGSEQTLLENPGERLAILAGIPPKDTIVIILKSTAYSLDSEQFVNAKNEFINYLNTYSDLSFNKIRTIGSGTFLDELFLSEDKQHLLIIANTNTSITGSNRALESFPSFIKSWNQKYNWLSINYLSQGTVTNEIFRMINNDLDRSLIFTIPITLSVLVWAFKSILVALLPLILASVCLVCSLGVSALLSRLIEPVSATSSQLVVLLVLAIGVDYSLFILSRVREECRKGASFKDSIIIAQNTTGRAVFWSGLTVALSLMGLAFMRDTVMTSMALISIVAVIITVFSSLWIFPSMLLILGEGNVVGKNIKLVEKKNNISSSSKSLAKLQYWIIKKSIAKPLLGVILSLLVLSSLVYFAFKLKIGTTIEPTIFPTNMQSREAMDIMSQQFRNASGTGLAIIFDAPKSVSLEDNVNISEFVDQVLEGETLKGPVNIEIADNKKLARYDFIAVGSANDIENQELIKNLRENLIPKLAMNSGIQAYISGTLPYVVDEMQRYKTKTPIVFSVVLALCFIFLLFAFRSIVVPLKAILLNILSTASAFGIIVLVFEMGILGRWQYGVIEAFVPALLYSILFGLSMDYHVFLLSRVQEEVLKGSSTKEAVKQAVVSTSSTITSAALIMVSVFVVVATLELPLMKELGLGLAVAIIIDATIIRLVLLPASMILLNSWNWYLPKCLNWIPKVKI